MSTRKYQCTRCGEVFTYASDRDALYCPLCGSTARYVGNTQTTTTTRKTTGSKYFSVTFTDPDTNIKIGTANVPDGWKYGAAIQSYNQSLLVQYLGICQVQKSDGSAIMFAKTGDNYLDVRTGINPNEIHQDGQINQYFNIPMLRLDSTENYLNSIAPGYVQNAKLTAQAISKLPSYYAENAKAFTSVMNKEITDFSAYFKNGSATFEAGAPVTESKLVQYSYTRNRTKYIMLLGTDLGAYEFRLTTQSNNNNNMMNIMTSLLTGGSNVNTGQYIHWGSKLLFGLITTEDNYNNVVNDFLNFVNSFRIDSSFNSNLKKIGTTSANRKTTKKTTANDNTGFTLTDILSTLLNASGGNSATDGSNNLSFDWTKLFK